MIRPQIQQIRGRTQCRGIGVVEPETAAVGNQPQQKTGRILRGNMKSGLAEQRIQLLCGGRSGRIQKRQRAEMLIVGMVIDIDDRRTVVDRISRSRNPFAVGTVHNEKNIRRDPLSRRNNPLLRQKRRIKIRNRGRQDPIRLKSVVAQNSKSRAERTDRISVGPFVGRNQNPFRRAQRRKKRGIHQCSPSSSSRERRILSTRSPSSRFRSGVKRRTGVYLRMIVPAIRF